MKLKRKKEDLLDLPFTKQSVFVLVLNLGLSFLILMSKVRIPPEVPLLYGRAFGEAQLAPWYMLSIPPLVASVVIILDYALMLLLDNDFLQKILFSLSVLATLLAFVTVGQIYLLVGM